MGTYPQIKFYRGAKADVELKSPAKGSIWFNTANGSMNIRIEKSDKTLDWESYSGYRNVSFANGVLTFTKADGTTKDVEISGFVSEGDYNNFYKEFTDFVAAQAQVDSDQNTLIEANKNAIADLLGDDKNTDGTPTSSIRQIVVDELAAQLLNENGAVDNFKTLQELAA